MGIKLYYIGTGANLVDWQLRQYGGCPFCTTETETTEHVLKCTHAETLEHWNEEVTIYETWLKRIKTSAILRNIILTELYHWRRGITPPEIQSLTRDLQTVIMKQRRLGWKNFLEGLVVTDWAVLQRKYKPSSFGFAKSRAWVKKLIKVNWTLLHQIWTRRNSKLHETQTIHDREGHKDLLRAIEQEWKIGLHQLPIREFAYLFQIKWTTLQLRTTEYLKAWFVKVRLGRELYKDSKLIQDRFSDQGLLRRWVGMETNSRREKELIKAIKKEQRVGIGSLSPTKFEHMFQNKNMHTNTHTQESQILWLRTIRRERERIEDPHSILDAFSVQGPLRQWIGLSK